MWLDTSIVNGGLMIEPLKSSHAPNTLLGVSVAPLKPNIPCQTTATEVGPTATCGVSFTITGEGPGDTSAVPDEPHASDPVSRIRCTRNAWLTAASLALSLKATMAPPSTSEAPPTNPTPRLAGASATASDHGDERLVVKRRATIWWPQPRAVHTAMHEPGRPGTSVPS